MLYKFISLIVIFGLTYGLEPTIKLKHGIIEGHLLKTIYGREFEAYEGVPYAKPPVGKLRFEPPQPIERWVDVWKANTLPYCMQYLQVPAGKEYQVIGNEDCLYLNIYKPKGNVKDLNVIVYIHGGAFTFNAGSVHRPTYLMNEDVVLVMVHYRLGPLGFLSFEDEILPGNNGMKDQTLALKWIKDNVKSFGGNPESITIVGLSAGGASVNLHTLSPLSKGLFHKASMQSGVSLNPWVISENAKEKAYKMGALLGCSTSNSKHLLKCLKRRPAKQIVEAVKHFQKFLYNPFTPFGPVIDKWSDEPFLPQHPLVLMKNNAIADVPVMFSFAECEGLYPAIDFAHEKYLKEINANWNDIVPHILDYNFTIPQKELNKVSQIIRQTYMGDKQLTMDNFYDFVKMLSDRLFVKDIVDVINLYTKQLKSSVYAYKFSYNGKSGLSTMFSPGSQFKCASHGDDGLLLLPMMSDPLFSKTDEVMSKMLINMLMNFAKNGYPTCNNVDWKPVSKGESNVLNYLNVISPENIKMVKDAADDIGRGKFWKMISFKENERLSGIKDEL